ncbi:MAG: 4Fe-4S dicluster domain-containing protein [Candidatus Lokiarchaeota archaeon]|nr:4Fe-4S dicluster domain-containing protein [Candidatus Lokiarchaeota archaeon]
MTEIDYYDIVREKLNVEPLRVPKHEKTIELLKVLWDEDVIKVLSYFPAIGKGGTSVKELIEKSGLEKNFIRTALKKAVDKKTIVKEGRAYGLAPLLPGIFEAYFIARQDTEENLNKAAKIFRYIFKHFPEFKPNFINPDFGLFRPLLPIGKDQKNLIEINEAVNSETQVLTYELVEDLINNNNEFAVIPCQCRYVGELSGEPCEVASADMGCFCAGRSAIAMVDAGIGRRLNKEEAIEYLKKTEKAGLVHCSSNSKGGEHLMFICNCCGCHCGALNPVKQGYKTVVPSNYTPVVDEKTCVQCKVCVKKCPMETISFNEEENKVIINLDYCIGCGVCATNCAKNAIKMNKTKNEIPPEKNKVGGKVFMRHLSDLLI